MSNSFHFGQSKTVSDSVLRQAFSDVTVEFAPSQNRYPVGGFAKRTVDLLIAVIALGMLAPMFLMVAALIWMIEGGPVVFAHPRVGFGGRIFPCYKFRTMRRDSDEALRDHLRRNPGAAEEWAAIRKLKSDPRITWFGRILRETSIDELPQLINIIKGDMSCVGPRPITSEEADRYGSRIALYLRARPGLTGLWQISGRSDTTYHRRVSFDVKYILNWSLLADVYIVIKTLPVVVSGNGSR